MGANIPCTNLKKAGLVVAFVEFILCLLAVYGLFRNLHLFGASYFWWWLVGIISVVIILLAIALMLFAICKEKPRWLVPHLSAQLFLILFLIVVAIIVTLLLVFGAYRGIRNLLGISNYYMSDDSTFILGIMMIVIYLLVAVLECFFLYIVWKLYKHLSNYEMLRHGYPSDNKKIQWSTVGNMPKDNQHGAPHLGDVYLYNQDRDSQGFSHENHDERMLIHDRNGRNY